jgi:SAM-dependent methyltransferase
VDEASLTTAHQRWDDAWRDDRQRAPWLEPDAAVERVVAGIAPGSRCLDVGCGVGRHSALLARHGFAVVATDASAAAVDQTRQAIGPTCARTTFDALPFVDGAFSYVLAWNVVYHGDGAVVRDALGDIARVLRAGGTYQATMLSKRNAKFGRGVEVRPDTWMLDGDTGDKAHPHFYCDETALRALHEPWFDVVSVEEVEQQRTAGAWHWQFVARRR